MDKRNPPAELLASHLWNNPETKGSASLLIMPKYCLNIASIETGHLICNENDVNGFYGKAALRWSG